MATEIRDIEARAESDAMRACQVMESREPDETKLLLQAFELFTNASTSLETAFVQLQAHAQKLTEELAAKNVELETSLREKQAAQNYLRTILERLPCGVLVLDGKGQPALCNPMALEVLEQTRTKSSPKRNRPFLKPQMRKHLAASAARSAEIEVPFVHAGVERTLATSGTPLTDEGGKNIGTLHIIRDVTEVKALQEQGKRVERLTAMGEIVVELAHEIRRPVPAPARLHTRGSELRRLVGQVSLIRSEAAQVRVRCSKRLPMGDACGGTASHLSGRFTPVSRRGRAIHFRP